MSSSTTPNTAIPQPAAILSTVHSAHSYNVPKDRDVTVAKSEQLPSQSSQNVAGQRPLINQTAFDGSQDAMVGDANKVSLTTDKGPNSGKVSHEYLHQAELTLETNRVSGNTKIVVSAMEVDGTTSVPMEISDGTAMVTEAQKRAQNDPPSDSDVIVSKKPKEDEKLGHKMGQKSGHSDTEVHMVTDPSMDISVNTESHKEFQTSSDTLSPLSPTEEEYIGSGSIKRLSDSGYNTTGVYHSEENLSFRSRGHTRDHTLEDAETFSEDSLDNLDEASDQLHEAKLTWTNWMILIMLLILNN